MFEVGNDARCGTCGKETKILDKMMYGKEQGFHLECGHRNGFCSTHKRLVMDASDTGGEIHTMCENCIAEQIEMEESIPEEYRREF